MARVTAFRRATRNLAFRDRSPTTRRYRTQPRRRSKNPRKICTSNQLLLYSSPLRFFHFFFFHFFSTSPTFFFFFYHYSFARRLLLREKCVGTHTRRIYYYHIIKMVRGAKEYFIRGVVCAQHIYLLRGPVYVDDDTLETAARRALYSGDKKKKKK